MMVQTESKAEHVFSVVDTFWPVPEDLQHPNPSEAVNAAREVGDLLFEGMQDQGLPRGQGLCLLICATKSGKVQPVALVEKNLAAIITEKQLEPIGIAFAIMVVGTKDIMLRVRVFENSERTARLLAEIQTHLALDIKAQFSRKAN